jgi:hypothetical protein
VVPATPAVVPGGGTAAPRRPATADGGEFWFFYFPKALEQMIVFPFCHFQ